MAKTKAAVFTAKINAVNGQQPAIVVVTVPEGGKTWQHAVVSTGRDAHNRLELYKHSVSAAALATSPVFPLLFPSASWASRPEDTLTTADVVLEKKIDEQLVFKPSLADRFEGVKLGEFDYSNSGSTLEAYIKANFTVSNEVADMAGLSKARKIIYPRDNVDWNLTWNSNVFTAEEKRSMEHPIDLDIAMSNADRDCRKIVEKILTTRYYNKNFTCIGLHGNPGGGKTKMVLNDICAINHIPAVAIPCDPMMGITQLLAQVGPVNQKAMVSSEESAQLIQGLKNRLTLLEQIANRSQDEEKELHKIVETLNNLANVSKECAELVKTPSILMKCLKNNLPLVVFLDEANCSSTQFQNSLAPIISDGIFKDGPEVGHNKGTIKWVLAWNPNTSNTKSFDGKFFDRMSFVQVEDVPDTLRIAYRLRKTLHGMYDATPDYSKADAVLAVAKVGHPELEAEIDAIAKDIHSYNASAPALEWAAKERLSNSLRLTKPMFEPDQFCLGYLGDAPLDTQENAAVAITLIDDLVQKINNELYTQTVGKDKKNPDKNSFLYISDRNLDVFTDMIFSYSSVRKGVYRYLFDLIPGGNTMTPPNTTTKGTEDKTPQIIAQAICDKLDGEMITLNNTLFTEIEETEIAEACGALANAQYDANLWIKVITPTPEEIAAAIQTTEQIDVAAALAAASDLSNEIDALLG